MSFHTVRKKIFLQKNKWIKQLKVANDFLERDEKLVNDIECFIKSMELVSRDNGNFIHTPEEKKQMEEGLEKFHKIFLSLWW